MFALRYGGFIPHSSLNLKLAVIFIAVIVGISMVLKPIAILMNKAKWKALPKANKLLYFLTPVVALRTVERSLPATSSEIRRLILRTFIFGVIVCAYYLTFWTVFKKQYVPTFWDGYFIVPLAYFMGVFIGGLFQLYGACFTGVILAPFHVAPYRSESLRDFWSHRWNTYVSDAFRELFLDRFKRKTFFHVAVIFALSGLFHEFLINIPYAVISGRSLLGSMMIYFVLQIIGLSLERTSLRPGDLSNRLFVYMVVVGPAPLILNEALLHVINIWPH